MKRIFFLLIAIVFTVNALAQNVERDSFTLSREMLLEREYSPVINDAAKSGFLPELREPSAPRAEIDFSNYAAAYDFAPYPSQRQPDVLFKDMRVSNRRGYLNGRLGTSFDAGVDAGYRIFDGKKDYLDVYLSQIYGNGRRTFLQDKDLSQVFKYMDIKSGLNFVHNFDKARLYADAKYTFSEYNLSNLRKEAQQISPNYKNTFYSAKSGRDLSPENDLFEACIGLSSTNDPKIGYDVNIRYYFFGQKRELQHLIPQINENRVRLGWDLHNNISVSSRVGLAGYYSNVSYYKSNEFTEANYDLKGLKVCILNPYYRIERNNFDLTIGGKLDIRSNTNTAYVSQAIRYKWRFHKMAHFYASLEGGREDNSKYSIFHENRYVNSENSSIYDSYSPLDATAGVTFLPVTELSVNLFGGYKITWDEHYFIPYFEQFYSLPETRYFRTLISYNDEYTFKVGGEVKYLLTDRIEIDVKASYYKRKLRFDNSYITLIPAQKPDMDVYANIRYRVQKLHLNLAYRGLLGRETNEILVTIPDVHGTFEAMKKMNDIHNVSIKAVYPFYDNLSAYITVDNLLFQRYELWYGYPMQPFSVIAGINFLF
ncbi:MAG: hypothetical protein LBS54_09125 [Dysgonamonadaceae bacterium]|jgi:hypothetical protein|nr:hypothetical protein [Dysgonamonadaceae bacterium]